MKYSAQFNLQVVKFAQESNNCAAGRQLCQRKVGARLAKANQETKVHAEEQMQQPRQIVPVARVRRQASPMD